MHWDWLRYITVMLSFIGIVQLLLLGKRTKQPVVVAPISWLSLIIGYSIFKIIVKDDLGYYDATVAWVNVILIIGIILIIVGASIFRDIDKWIIKQ